MRCPYCQFTVSNKKDVCGRCFQDLRPKKREMGLAIFDSRTPIEVLVEREKAEANNRIQPATPQQNTDQDAPALNPAPSSTKPSMPPWLLKLFFTKTAKPSTGAQVPPKETPIPSAQTQPVKSTPEISQQPSVHNSVPTSSQIAPLSKPTIKQNGQAVYRTSPGENDSVINESLLKSTQFTEDVRKVLEDTFNEPTPSAAHAEALNSVSIEQLMHELEEITSSPEYAAGSTELATSSTAVTTQPSALEMDALLSELDQAPSIEEDSNEELNRLFELALSLEDKVSEAKDSTEALAAHPFSESIACDNPIADVVADNVVDLETVDPVSDPAILEPLVSDDYWNSVSSEAPNQVIASATEIVREATDQPLLSSPQEGLAQEVIIDLTHTAPDIISQTIELGSEKEEQYSAAESSHEHVPFAPNAEDTSTVDNHLLNELLTLVAEVYGVTSDILLGKTTPLQQVDSFGPANDEELKTESAPSTSPLSELSAELDKELELLRNEGTTILRTDNLVDDQTVDNTSPDSVPTVEPEAEPDPISMLSDELDKELAGLISEGTSINSLKALSTEEEVPTAKSQPMPCEMAPSIEQPEKPSQDNQCPEQSVIDSIDFSEELAILAREAELYASSQVSAPAESASASESSDASFYESSTTPVQLVEAKVSSDTSLSQACEAMSPLPSTPEDSSGVGSNLEAHLDDSASSPAPQGQTKNIRHSPIEDTQVIDNSELMKLVAEIEVQFDSQQKKTQVKSAAPTTPLPSATPGESSPTTEQDLVTPQFAPASPTKRMAAALVDSLACLFTGALISLSLISAPTRSALLSFSIFPFHQIAPDLVLVIGSVFFSWIATNSVLSSQGMQSIGFRIFGYMVVDDEGFPLSFSQGLLRALSMVVSLLTLGLGFLTSFGKNRRALHDYLSGTQVILEFVPPEQSSDVIREKVYELAE